MLYQMALILPFCLLILLVLIARRPLWLGALLAVAIAIPLWLMVPGVEPRAITAAAVKAAILAFEVGLILLGAISFLEYLDDVGATAAMKAALAKFSAGRPLAEALLLAWLLCSFLEGAAGFGAPAALVAPLLLSLGYSPILSAVLPLLGDSAAVIFGAVGTPTSNSP